MAYRIKSLPSARRSLARLPKRVQQQASRRIDGLALDPRPAASKQLSGDLREFRRLRIGDYRVVYLIQDDALIVVVVAVGHRRDICEQVLGRRGAPS